MTLRAYLTLMALGTVFSWIIWIMVLFNISPVAGGFIGLVAFYLSLFMAILGTFSVIGFLIRRAIVKDDEIVFRHVRHTFRQSLLVATATVLILFLLSKGLLFLWNAAILVVFFIFIEIIIFSNRKHSNG